MVNRWLVAFACAWVNLFIFAVFRSGGVVYLAIIDQFKCTHQQAAWSVSLAGSVASTTGLIAGFLTHYFSVRILVITGVCISAFSVCINYVANSIEFVTLNLGLLQGIGIGFVTNLLPAVLNAHFGAKKSIALGISYAGATLGAFIFPLIMQTLFTHFLFHNTMLLVGALILSGVIGGFALQPVVESKEQQQALESTIPMSDESNQIVSVENDKLCDNITQNEPTDCNSVQVVEARPERTSSKLNFFYQNLKGNLKKDLKILCNRYFLLCAFTYLNFIFDFVAFIIILPDVAKGQGIEDVNSKWLLSLFSITDFAGRILPGWLSYWNVLSDKSLYVLSITILGLCMGFMVLLHTWTHFMVLTLICGFVTGCQMVLSPAILADYLGAHNTAIAFGTSNFLCGLITLVLRPLIIGVKDIYGDYNLLGYILSSMALLSTASWLIEMLSCVRK